MKKFTFLTTFLKMVPCRTCVSSSFAVYPVDPAQINLAALYTFRLDSTTHSGQLNPFHVENVDKMLWIMLHYFRHISFILTAC